MASKKKKAKMPPVLDLAAVKERQKELRTLAKSGGPNLATASAFGSGNCTWKPFDVIVIGPNGVEHRIEWRCV